MFPVRSSRTHSTALVLAGVLLLGVLPATALAADPVAGDDSYTVGVDATTTSLNVLSNDTDADAGDTLTITGVTLPANGTAAIVAGGAIDYTPDAAFHGTDTFQYTIEDSTAVSSTATVTVIVNDPPLAFDDPGTACQPGGGFGGAFPIPEDFVGTTPPTDQYILFGSCAPLGNDTDPNADTLDYEILDQPTHGDVLYIDPTFVAYRPDPNYSTKAGDQTGGQWVSDSFTYRAFDGLSYSEPATMRFWIAPINDVPTFTPGGTVTVGEDSGAYSGSWATNVSPGPLESDQTVHFEMDVDLNGVPNLFAVAPSIDADGVLAFTPAPDEVGLVHVTVRAKDNGGLPAYSGVAPTPPSDDTSDDVTFDILVTPDAVTAADDTTTVPEDPDPGPWLVDVLANDTAPVGATVTTVSQGTLGDVTIAPDGLSVLYAPHLDANGADTFTYTLDDGAGSTDAATVSVDVTPVNDAPAGAGAAIGTNEDTPRTLVAADFGFSDPGDTPPNLLSGVKVSTLPASGALKDNGAVVVVGAIIPVADIAGNKLVFAPVANASGSPYATFTFQVRDNGGTVGGGVDLDQTPNTITINVAAVNDNPVANADSLTVVEDAPATSVQVLTNDTDVEGDARTITARTNGAKGVVVLGSSTTLTYKPNANATGSDTFTYTISDGHGGTAVGTVNVTITPVNDVPNAVNDATFTVPVSAGATNLLVLANDTDADGDVLTITATTNGAHGTVAITGAGTGLTYDPVQLYFGTDVFTYTIRDGHGGSDTATVLLTIAKDTTPPAVVGPAEAFYAHTVGSTTMNARISWSGSDAGTGIARYEIQVSVNGGAFASTSLPTATSTSINRTLTDEKSYRFRVRATDKQGNVSAWVNGPAFKPGRIQNTSTSIKYGGPWATISTSSALGGSHRYASSLSASASITRTVRDFGFVATKSPGSGSAQVWIDGVLAATIDLRSTSIKYRQLVFSRHFSTIGSHKLEIRPIGGGRVYLDAFLVMR